MARPETVEAGIELLATITKGIARLVGKEMTDEEAEAHARRTLAAAPDRAPLPNADDLKDIADDGKLNGSAGARPTPVPTGDDA